MSTGRVLSPYTLSGHKGTLVYLDDRLGAGGGSNLVGRGGGVGVLGTFDRPGSGLGGEGCGCTGDVRTVPLIGLFPLVDLGSTLGEGCIVDEGGGIEGGWTLFPGKGVQSSKSSRDGTGAISST